MIILITQVLGGPELGKSSMWCGRSLIGLRMQLFSLLTFDIERKKQTHYAILAFSSVYGRLES